MAQQTAVDWLLEHLMKLDKELDGRRKNEDATVLKLNPTKIYERAKQMEKQQIINAVDDQNNYDSWPSSIPTLGAQYYNETYGKTDNNTGTD
jgi:hypothetical protein